MDKFSEYFSYGFVINLDADVERMARVSARLQCVGIPFERFPALTRSEPPAAVADKNLGLAACAASHRAVLKLIEQRGLERAIIFEDDVVLRDDAADWLTRLVPQLQAVAWDVFYLGLHLMGDGGWVTENLGRVGRGHHTHAYAVTRSAIPRLIACIDRPPEKCRYTFDALDDPRLVKVYASPILPVQEPSWSRTLNRQANRLHQYFPPFDREDFFAHCAEARSWELEIGGREGRHLDCEVSGSLSPVHGRGEGRIVELPSIPRCSTLGPSPQPSPLRTGEREQERLSQSKVASSGDKVAERMLAMKSGKTKSSMATIQANAKLAMEHQRGGRTKEAEALWKKVLEAQPEHPAALHYSGMLAHGRGEQAVAVDLLFRSLAADPDCPEFHNNLAALLNEAGRGDEALELLDEAIRLKEDYAEAHSNRGVVLEKLGRLVEAEGAWLRAIELNRDAYEPRNRLGVFLLKQGRAAEAVNPLREAVRLNPRAAPTHLMLGNALREAGEMSGAVAAYRKCVEVQPGWAEAHSNLGAALNETGRLEEAQAELEKAISLKGDLVDAHWNLALALLASGQFERGWLEYEWRRRLADQQGLANRFPHPEWNGLDVAGRTVLVVCEQGLGDTIQFIRYAPLLARRGAKVVVECQPRLRPLLRGIEGVEQVVARGEPLPPFDTHVRLLSLPGILHTRVETVPGQVPFLATDPVRVERWKRELGTGGFNIGIAWQGSSTYKGDRFRSIPLRHFAPLAAVPGVRLWALQKGLGTEQIAQADFPVMQFEGPMDEEAGAFVDSAAIIKALDLVVSSDTSVPHLAGALGAPVWLALPHAADWRWLAGREDCPWYPTMRLFRQTSPGDWAGVFERIAAALRQMVGASAQEPPAGPVLAPVTPGQLIDRITILQIKARQLTDSGKLKNVRAELDELCAVRDTAMPRCDELDDLERELRAVNEKLWRAEDEIRGCDAAGDFGPNFVELAQRVYRTNDRRAEVKCRIDTLLGSELVEEKQYATAGRNR